MEDHMINAQINHSIETVETDLEMDLSIIRTRETMETFLVLLRLKGETSHKNNSYRQPRGDQPDNSAFRRSDNRPTTGFTHYEQKFPQSYNQTSSKAVRFTTTDVTNNEVSDTCPLN